MISPRVESLTGTNSIRSPSSRHPPRVLVILGTRPEAIKLAPVISRLKSLSSDLQVTVCVTAQHRSLLDQALRLFNIQPDLDLNVMQPGQSLAALTARLLQALEPVFEAVKPDLTVLQGDTTTALCAALASFYARVPVAHVEAGLRTFDLTSPFPEELNRVLLTTMARLHFTPTEWSASNLVRSGVCRNSVHVTGNTAIDAILDVSARLEHGSLPGHALRLDSERHIVIVTAHRRENSGAPLEHICRAVAELARRNDIQIVWPVHPSPQVRPVVYSFLAGTPHVHLIEPLEYAPFVDLLRKSLFVITDSGGLQEEGPSLGKPILVLRDKTERPEGIHSGTVRLVGHDPGRIVTAAAQLLEDKAEYRRMAQIANPYGDGRAGIRIAQLIREFLYSQPA